MSTPEVTGYAASHSEEIKKIARQYAEKYHKDILRFCPDSIPDSVEVLIQRNQEQVIEVLEWLSKDYCIVPRSKVLEEYNQYKDSWTELEPNEDVIESFETIFGTELFNEEKE